MGGTLPFELAFAETRRVTSSIFEETGHLPLLDDDRLQTSVNDIVWMTPPGTSPRRVDFRQRPNLASELDTTNLDSVSRCVCLAVLFRIEHYDEALRTAIASEEEEDGELSSSNKPGDLTALRRHLDRYPVATLDDASLIWELHAAGATGYIERLVAICDQVALRMPTAEGLATASRCLFLGVTGHFPLEWCAMWVPEWSPQVLGDLRDLYEAATIFLACKLPANRLQTLLLRRPKEQQPQAMADRRTALKLRNWLDSLRLEAPPLSNEHQAISANTAFVLGPDVVGGTAALAEAGETFYRLSEVDSMRSRVLRESPLKASAACYLRAGQAESAERPLMELVRISKDAAAAQLLLVACYHLQSKEAQSIDALEDLMRIDTNRDEDPVATLALQFGLRAREGDDLRGFLASAAMATLSREQGEAIVDWIEPFYSRLSEVARRRWWTGLHVLSQPANLEGIGERTWGIAAAEFAEAVNLELRALIFRPFFKALPADVRKTLRSEVPERRRIASDRGSLGQHFALLEATRSAGESDRLAGSLYEWLQRTFPGSQRHLLGLSDHASTLTAFRNDAVHGSITRDGAHRVFRAARAYLEGLVRFRAS